VFTRSIFRIFALAMLAVALGAGTGNVAGQAPAKRAEPVKKKQGKPRKAKVEKLACKLGTEDNHARIAVELHDGKVNRFAYYSKWKPRTCSMEVERDDAYSKWVDTGDTTVVTLTEDKGAFLIENGKARYHFIFRDIDRMRYCGMEGKVSGSLTIYRGKSQCELDGVMERDGAPEKPKPTTAAGPDGVGKPPPAIPAPANPVPVAPAPANPVPVAPVPANPAPATSAPVSPAPAASTPVNPVPAKPAPAKIEETKKP
jgi:hypothetical protein